MNRTIRIELLPSPEQAAALEETSRLFTAVFNAVCQYGWDHCEKNGVRLHHAMYKPLKVLYPNLVSDLHVQARAKAAEAVKSSLTWKKKAPQRASCPISKACPPRFNLHTFKVFWEQKRLSLSTCEGRKQIPFLLPAYASKYVGLEVATADLVHREGRWFFHIVVKVPRPEIHSNLDVVGVDLGLVQPAVTSNNRFLGRKKWRCIDAKYFKLRQSLQKAGTRSDRRHIRKLKGKQRRFHRDCDHVLSKQIAKSVSCGGTIVVENLTNIRTRIKVKHKTETARRIHGWSFAQVRFFVTYKAEERGCTVVGVNPRHTSQRCSHCGYTARNNRRSRALFTCRTCGYSTHADRNGALNIAAKYRAGLGISGSSGLPVNEPIVPKESLSPSSAN